MNTGNVVLNIDDVSKSYLDPSGQRKTILKHVKLNILEGEILLIMGPSGVGKTTLLNIIGLLDEPNEGNVVIKGKSTAKLNNLEKAEMRNRHLGLVFQHYYLMNNLNVLENVILPMIRNPELAPHQRKKRAFELLELVRMSSQANQFPDTLSGGELQRVSIARSLANNPDIILADEPTGSVDGENEQVIINILNEIAQKGKAVVIVSHNEIFKSVANRVFMLTESTLKELTI